VNAQKYMRPKGQICAVSKGILNKASYRFSFADNLSVCEEFEFE
jgi:hypothetical protein